MSLFIEFLRQPPDVESVDEFLEKIKNREILDEKKSNSKFYPSRARSTVSTNSLNRGSEGGNQRATGSEQGAICRGAAKSPSTVSTKEAESCRECRDPLPDDLDKLPKDCPIVTGVVPGQCRFDPKFFRRMVAEGVIGIQTGCPLLPACKLPHRRPGSSK